VDEIHAGLAISLTFILLAGVNVFFAVGSPFVGFISRLFAFFSLLGASETYHLSLLS
jgi:hypothetical protein